MNIPIYIICFNNGMYVENTLQQLNSKNILNDNIYIINNNSDGKDTCNILQRLSSSYNIINLDQNHGHRVWAHSLIWDKLPEYFIITDPDLEYNKNLPDNFIDILYGISTTYNASKVGFALNIESTDISNENYINNMTIKEWESQFWKNSLPKYNELDLYQADIDTTFFLGCKSRMYCGFSSNINIRVGSEFICKHLPWHTSHNNSLNKDTLNEMYLNNNTSTTGKIIKNLAVMKNDI